MRKLWKKYSRLGVTDNTIEARRIIFSNQLIPFLVVIIAIISFFDYRSGQKLGATVLASTIPLFCLIPFFNSKYYTTFSKFLFIFLANAVVFIVSSLETPGPPYPFFAVPVLPFLLFSYDKKWLIHTSVAITFILWFIYDFYVDPDPLDDAFHYVLIYSTFLFILLPVYLFLMLNYKAEIELKETRDEIIAQNEELRSTTDLLYATQEKLESETKKALESSNYKSQFLSQMSHEIRTPLNAIVGFSDLAESETNLKEIKADLKSIRHAANHLTQIINDILDISKIESGKIELIEDTFNVQKLLVELKKNMERECKQKLLQFHLDVDPAIKERYIADGLRINQILLNLCSNAVKFTERGSVRLIVIVKKESPNEDLLEFSVADTGIGIRQQDQKKIFENFLQLSSDNQTKGTGLGLGISKKLVELLGGELDVESTLGQGSTFKFSIPLRTEPHSELKRPKPPVETRSALNQKALLIEDNELNQELTKNFLESRNLETSVVVTADAAINLMESEKFDLIISDNQLPGMSGLELVEKLKSDPEFDTPIIIFTADATPEMKTNASKAGVDGLIFKPVVRAEFLRVVNQILD